MFATSALIYQEEMNLREKEHYNEEGIFFKKIANTTFKVRVFTDKTETERASEKIIRIIKNVGLTKQSGCAIIRLPRMSRLSERSSA